MTTRAASRPVLGAVVGALLLAGCSGQGTEPEPETTTPGPDAVVVAPEVTIPQTRAGTATQWVLDQLAAPEGPAAEEVAERFEERFREQVPDEDLAAVFDQLRASGPFTVEGYSGTEDDAQLPLAGPVDRFVLHLGTQPDGRMSVLFFEIAEPVPEVTSLDDLDAALAGLPAETSVLVAEVDDGTCRPLLARDADVVRPIGSIVKLYVLDAVRYAVADGELGWQDTLTLTDDLRSLPSGTLQDEPTGTEVTVEDAAAALIAISDNTATDLLIDAVGRPAVLAAAERLGHHDPDLLTPLITTREMFQLGFTERELRRRWAAADDAERQALLDGLPGGDVVIDQARAADVVWDDDLDWFATAEDLCRAHVGLQEETAELEAVRGMLAANPGIEVPAGWEHVAFKGGSSTGEMAGSWYLEHEDGRQVVVVVQIAGEDIASVPDAGWMVDVVAQAVEVLGEEGGQ
ncbi:Cpe/LpqF family protein [Georgenia sp. MJ170]|uniref:Cpe/LpqF family protein n=1 Tax=Georgenia sunbinii TaxID=3117728 RepID=UPI002F266965